MPSFVDRLAAELSARFAAQAEEDVVTGLAGLGRTQDRGAPGGASHHEVPDPFAHLIRGLSLPEPRAAGRPPAGCAG